MSSTGGSTPRPEWRAMLAAISALFLILCLCVMVTAARGQGGGLAGALLRRFADVPVLGRLVEPLLRGAPAPAAPASDQAMPKAAEAATATPVVRPDYLVRPTHWPTEWAWPPRPLGQPATAPQVQPTAVSVPPPAAPAPAPAATATPSDEEQRQRMDQQSGQGPSG